MIAAAHGDIGVAIELCDGGLSECAADEDGLREWKYTTEEIAAGSEVNGSAGVCDDAMVAVYGF